jgi:small GTP-binding protein
MQVADPQAYHGRIVLIGDSSVGKTSLLNRLVEGRYDLFEPSTVGANYKTYRTEIDRLPVELQIWDTAGQEKFAALGPIYFRNAQGAVAVFDVTNHDTFSHLEKWISSFSEVAGGESVVIVVGNKIDLAERSVSRGEAAGLAERSRFRFFEASAKTGQGVKDIFDHIAREMVGRRPTFEAGAMPEQSGVRQCC